MAKKALDVMSGVSKNGMGCFVPGRFVWLPLLWLLICLLTLYIESKLSNSGDTDEMPLFVAFHQGLHSFQRKSDLPSRKYNTKPLLSGHSKIDETKVLKA